MLKHALVLFMSAVLVASITETTDGVAMRDASGSKNRPNLEKYDLTEENKKTAEAGKENFEFNADVSRLMDIIINSLYTKKDVFIRELISNASDALDKARFVSVSQADYLGSTPDLEIKIDFNDKEKTLSITDTGIGMTKAELIKNLGTVAKSGTTAFLEAMGQGDKNMSMIGQFGVGFYSAYLVANTVQVTSKNNDDEQYIWTSTADSKFSIAKDPRGNTLGRGTRVTLHLKDDALEYVEQDKIKNLVKRYSEFINYPIRLYTSKDVQKEVPDEAETPKKDGGEVTKGDDKAAEEPKGEEEKKNEDDKDAKKDDKKNEDGKDAKKEDGVEIKDEGEKKEEEKPKMKTITEQEWNWEHINEIKAIWMRPKEELTEEMYNNFYKTITKDADNPIAYSHFSAEGEIEFKAILYIPGSASFDLYDNYYGRKSSLKLYVRRVLISEDFEELMPKYLNFVKGVVDSDDLPLNVSREQLQQLKMIKVMSKKLVRKTIDMIKELAAEAEEEESSEEEKDGDKKDKKDVEADKKDEKKKDADKKDADKKDSKDEKKDDKKKDKSEEEEDKYLTFWKGFGKSIKLGVIEDSSNRLKLAKLLRFYSTEDPDKLHSLDDYIGRMKADQDTILYLPGDSKSSILKSPILKKYKQKGYEVLLLDDPIDEFCTQHLTEYEKRKVKSIAKDDVTVLEGSDKTGKKKAQKLKEMYKPLTDWFKKHLGKQVEKVAISQKLDDSPLFIFTSQYGFSAQMEKINKAQAFQNNEKAPGYMMAKKSLEINPHHPVMKKLLEKVKESEDSTLDEASTEYADLLFQMALLQSGFAIEQPSVLSEPLQRLVNVGFGLKRDEKVEEIEVDISDDEPEEKKAETKGDAEEPKGEEEPAKKEETAKPADATAASGNNNDQDKKAPVKEDL